ncbi:hypothetical protein FOZ62_015038 [Perkinsus olseni]|uniref:Uncharacterized protein n=1 Tax=Perkinsus olseni TaxID=32597 RepID=A0A7J6R1X6_PEROL|nr:hypothetical protein FOZ62_015038 [Perkinsus olseni]
MATGFVAALQDPEKRKIWLADNMDNIRFWGIFTLVGLVLFYLSSDWDFSMLLTISSMISMFSFLMVVVKIGNFTFRGRRIFSSRLMVS